MFARNTIMAATVMAGLLAITSARAQTTAAAAPAPAAGSTHGSATHGSALPGIEFGTEAEAHAHCPADKLVWANLTSKAYHFSGDRYYGSGKTKHGAYMCLTDADANGFHKAGARHAAAAAKKPS
jgi:hypothetical protein